MEVTVVFFIVLTIVVILLICADASKSSRFKLKDLEAPEESGKFIEVSAEQFLESNNEEEKRKWGLTKEECDKYFARLKEVAGSMEQDSAHMRVSIFPSGATEVKREKSENSVAGYYIKDRLPYGCLFSRLVHPMLRIHTLTAESKLKEWKSKAIETLKETGSIEINDKVYMIQPGGSVEFGEITYEENDNDS